jgi:hypothetical protein
MIFYILLGVLLFMVVVTWLGSRTQSRDDRETARSVAVFIAVMVMAVYFVISASVYESDNGDNRESSRQDTPIVAMGNSTAISGNYQGGVFASYGMLNSSQVINFVAKDTDGGLHLRQAEARNATVYQQDGDPHITEIHFTKHIDNSIMLPWMKGTRDGGTWTNLYVPKGSVQSDFSLDTGK